VRKRDYYEEILKEKRCWCCQTSVLDFKSFSETRALPPVLLDSGARDPDDLPTVQEEKPLP
jgi:hypothetical protein